MSTNTTVHVGVYLECMQTLVARVNDDPDPVCPKDRKHNAYIERRHNCCPQCGAPVDRSPKTENVFFGFMDLINGEDRLGGTDEDLDEVVNAFSWIANDWVGDETPGKDILTFNSTTIDADDAGMHVVPEPDHGFARPSQELVDKLQKVCGYSMVRVKYGVLVSIA